LGRLVGQHLRDVSIAEFSHSVSFDRDNIYGSGRLMAEKGNAVTVIFDDEALVDGSVLPKLVGATVAGWAVEGSHMFSVSLDNGFKLNFTGEDSPYEDFVIFDGVWVV
jgi:hypothetical protein